MRFFLFLIVIFSVSTIVQAQVVDMEVKLEIISKAQNSPLENREYFCTEEPTSALCQSVFDSQKEDDIILIEIEDGYVSYQSQRD